MAGYKRNRAKAGDHRAPNKKQVADLFKAAMGAASTMYDRKPKATPESERKAFEKQGCMSGKCK